MLINLWHTMKQPVENQKSFKHLAGSLSPVKQWAEDGFGIRLSVQELAAVLLGFESLEELRFLPKNAPVHSRICLDEGPSARLLLKFEESKKAKRSAKFSQLKEHVENSFNEADYPLYDEALFDAIVTNQDLKPFPSEWVPSSIFKSERLQRLPAWFAEFDSKREGLPFPESGLCPLASAAYKTGTDYSASVFKFAREYIAVMGPQQERASRRWSVEFACDLHDKAFELGLFERHHESYGLLAFVVQEWAVPDGDESQGSQNPPIFTGIYDARHCYYLGESGKKLRNLFRVAYLDRYLSGKGFTQGLALEIRNHIIEFCNKGNFIAKRPSKPESEPQFRIQFGIPLETDDEIVKRIIAKLNDLIFDGLALTETTLKDLHEKFYLCKEYGGRVFWERLKDACEIWSIGAPKEKELAHKYLAEIATSGEPEDILRHVKLLLEYPLKEEDDKRAADLLLKIYKDVVQGNKVFQDSDDASTYVQLAQVHLANRTLVKNDLAALTEAGEIFRSGSIIKTRDIKDYIFKKHGQENGRICFDNFTSRLSAGESIGLQLGFCSVECVARFTDNFQG